MESQMEDTNLEQIITVLENMEIQNMADDPKIQDWLEQITNPEFQLVDSLINLFLDNLTDMQTTGNILKVLRKFNIYQRDNVLPQMRANTTFPKAISEYIIKTDLKEISGDAFYLLADIYKSSNFKELSSEPFVKALFDSLQIITDEDNFNAIVKILTNINYEESALLSEQNKPVTANTFIKVYQEHDNSRILIESLIRILNYEEKDKNVMYKICQCFMDIIDAVSDCIMYSSDLESFINLSIKKLESTYTEELRFYILSVLERILRYEEYYKTKYKFDELVECMESYIEHHSVDEKNKELCKKVLEHLEKH